MALLGKAAVAMWWHIAPEVRDDFLDWHTHEHQPERMGIAGFERGSRWTSRTDGTGFFVMYELADRAALTGPAYLARLNDPTPWSLKMMPHHQRMVRSLADVSFSTGAGIARCVFTLRLSPPAGSAASVRTTLQQTLTEIMTTRGVSGAHLLEAAPVAAVPLTKEQQIRGGDAAADWTVLVMGYEAGALSTACAAAFTAAEAAPAMRKQDLFELSGCLSRAEQRLG